MAELHRACVGRLGCVPKVPRRARGCTAQLDLSRHGSFPVASALCWSSVDRRHATLLSAAAVRSRQRRRCASARCGDAPARPCLGLDTCHTTRRSCYSSSSARRPLEGNLWITSLRRDAPAATKHAHGKQHARARVQLVTVTRSSQ